MGFMAPPQVHSILRSIRGPPIDGDQPAAFRPARMRRMKYVLKVLVAAAALAAAIAHADTDPALEHAKAVLAQGILFDGHNDLPWAIRQFKEAPGDVDAYDIREKAPGDGQTDIPRLRAGGVGADVLVRLHAGRGGRRLREDAARADRHRAPRNRDATPIRSRWRQPPPTSARPRPPAGSAACWARRAVMPSRIRWRCCACTTTSACAT